MLDSCHDQSMQSGHETGLGMMPAGRSASRAVRRAIEYIHANLEGNVRLGNIADAAGMSVYHFSRTFRRVTGLAPHRYLTRARVERVKGLLLQSDHGLAAIADEAGFTDQSHMSKAFRRMTGTSPAVFRNECRREYVEARARNRPLANRREEEMQLDASTRPERS